MIRRQLRDNVRWIIVIAVLCAGAALSIGYILSQQNLTFPWENRYVIHAEFATTAGLEPGLGQPVNVAGVRVGTIRDVRLKGRAGGRRSRDRPGPAAARVSRRARDADPDIGAEGPADRHRAGPRRGRTPA
ncbi:hypothetical protein GKE82_26535 [Conexibacter sp. W3-3-2]|uniref:MlaD family protein n=1 Tax=Conexibacter sp. W3-3-2 TaxID=2675227 RepID=UPI0012B95090|nr:MlaD family protein [Conexibacter sp. W3-3-2]MTD47758.1 hypothetical protein [Conexibacter sp. W3-3-2]